MTCIYASRSDGLGERLNAIFNGLLISELLSLDFKFCWPKNNITGSPFQSLSEVHEIFSESFILEYFVDEKDVPQGSTLRVSGRASYKEMSISLREQISKGAVITTQQEVLKKIIEKEFRHKILLHIRDKLRFTGALQAALDGALRSKNSERFVAIHIRAGDIVYGKFSERPFFYKKIIPTPMVLPLLESLRAEGHNIALFGQETEFIDLVTADFGLVNPRRSFVDHEKTPLNLAFEDLCGMGMAEKIVCGSSGFPRFSAQYFGVPIISPWSILPKGEDINKLANFILDANFNASYFSVEQRAYGLFMAFQLNKKNTTYEKLNSFIEGAVRLVPDNKMYQLWDVLNKIRFGKFREADEKFFISFSELNLTSISDFRKNRFARILGLKEISGKKELTYAEYYSYIQEGASKSLACGALLVFFEKRGITMLQNDLEVLKGWQEKFKNRIY